MSPLPLLPEPIVSRPALPAGGVAGGGVLAQAGAGEGCVRQAGVTVFPLLAAMRRENHLWHSGDSFVTLTVMLLCAGLTHRMNP